MATASAPRRSSRETRSRSAPWPPPSPRTARTSTHLFALTGPVAEIQLPISYDWFLLISRVTIALLVLGFLARVARIVASEALSARPAPGLQLTTLDGSQAMRLIRSRPVVIGRDEACDFVLRDPSVSGRHARLQFADGSWWLTDLGSTNGTWLNGARLAETASIASGDVVQFGRIDVLITDVAPDD